LALKENSQAFRKTYSGVKSLPNNALFMSKSSKTDGLGENIKSLTAVGKM